MAMDDSTRERETAETALRSRWAREVVAILKDADLPSARAPGATTGSSVKMRCCRELKALILKNA